MSLDTQVASHDVAHSQELVVFRQLHLYDSGSGRDLRIGKHLEGFDAVIDNLIELTKLYRYVGFGDFVRVRDQNLIVDTLKLLDIVLETYYPCPRFSDIVRKIRYVTKKDTILPEDHNYVVDAIKVARDCIAQSVSELELMPLDMKIAMLSYVEYEAPVLSHEYNAKIDALKELLKFIFRYIVIIEELTVELPLTYDYTYDVLEIPILPVLELVTTTEVLEVLARTVAELRYTTDTLDIDASIKGILEPTLELLDIPAPINAPAEFTTQSIDGLGNILGESYVTIDIISGLADIAALVDFPQYVESLADIIAQVDFPPLVSGFGDIVAQYDFPTCIEWLNKITLSFDFPSFIEHIAQVSLAYDFPQFITGWNPVMLQYSYFLDLRESLVSILASSDATTERVSEGFGEIRESHDTTTDLVEFRIPLFSSSDVHLAIGVEGVLRASFDFPSVLEKSAQVNLAYDYPDVIGLTLALSVAYDYPVVVGALTPITMSYDFVDFLDLQLTQSVALDMATSALDLATQTVLSLLTTLEAYDISSPVLSEVQPTLDSFDIPAITSLVLDRFLDTFDLEVLIGFLSLESTTEVQDRVLDMGVSVGKTTESRDITSPINLSYEFEYIYWLYGFDYRRTVTITNNAQEVYDYQVLIVLTPENFDYSKANPDGSDIRFTKDDGITKIPYWIELWNPQGESWIWVKIDHLPMGETTIYMYYGNPSAKPEDAPEQVFPLFDHFDEDTIGVKWKLKKGQGAVMARVIQP